MTKKFKKARSGEDDSASVFRHPLVLSDQTISISLSSGRRDELADVVKTLKTKFGLVDRYAEIVRCSKIAGHGYRIYADPSSPERYLALFVGFSEEELAADLYMTRQ